MRHDDCRDSTELREACRRRYREAVRKMRPGDRVRYHGWRGDSGTGTVMENYGESYGGRYGGRILVKRDFSADYGYPFFPLVDSRLEPL